VNIENVELIMLQKIREAIDEIGINDVKITLLKKIANQSIDIALNRAQYSGLNSKISAKFSGRGRAWAKIINDGNPAWNIMASTLTNYNKVGEDLLDMFETAGFAWLRFSNTNKNFIKLHARYNGSKNEDHIKVNIPTALCNYVENLDGVPHKIGIESGTRDKVELKEIDDTPVTKEELSSFGIQTLEDLLGES
jgi:hypothetical protein